MQLLSTPGLQVYNWFRITPNMDVFVAILYLLGVFGVYKLVDYVLRLPMSRSPSDRTRYVLITGCDSGFGNLFTKRLDAKGFTVLAACLTEQGKDELQRSCRHVKAFVMDVTSQYSVTAGYKTAQQLIGPEAGLWGIVNNAGVVGVSGMAEWLQVKDYTEVMEVNVYGIVRVVQTFLPLVKKCKGRIVNTASIVGRLALPCSAPYVLSKHAVEAYSDTIRRELRTFNISVHTVEPGWFKTHLIQVDKLKDTTKKVWDRLPRQLREEYGEKYYKISLAIMRKTLPRLMSPQLHHVVDAYEHAILSYFPRTRYMPGWDAKLFYWPLSLMPEWISDYVLTALLPTPEKKF